MGLNETIYAYLAEITLKQVVDGQAICDKSSVVSVNKSTPKVVA
jgi:hypothetical protein